MVATAPDVTDCVAYWKLEDASDSSGNGNTLTLSGATAGVSTGVIDKCGFFDGTNDRMYSSISYSDTPHSISLWFKAGALGTNVLYHVVNSDNGMEIYVSSGNIRFFVQSSASDWKKLSYAFTDTANWHHLVCVFDNSDNSILMYLDNVSVGNAESGGTLDFNGVTANTYLGSIFGGGSLYFNGLMDEVSIFDVALSADNVEYLYNSGNPGLTRQPPFTDGTAPTSTDCVAYWKMEDLTDLTGNGYTLTNNGATSGSTGIIDNCYSFDDSNDYMTAPSSTMVSLTEGSVSAWIKPNNVVGYHVVFAVGTTSNYWTIMLNDDHIRVMAASSGIKYLFDSDDPIINNAWTHILVTVDSNGNKLYVNGVLASVTYTTGSASNTEFFDDVPSPTVYIGDHAYLNSSFGGLIDETSVWNNALTADNVAYLYNYGLPTEAQQYDFSADITPTSTDCVCYLKLEDTTDSSGNGNSVTASGATTGSSAGIVDFGGFLDGSNDYLYWANNTFSTLSEGSISLWFKADDVSSDQAFFDWGGNNHAMVFGLDSTGHIRSYIYDSGFDWWFVTNTTYSIGTWYHVVLTVDSNGIHFYVNGEEPALTWNNGSAASTEFISDITIATATARLGTQWNSSNWFDGIIDEFSMWSTALTLSEVRYLYNFGVPGTSQQYPFGATPPVATTYNSIFFGINF